MSNDIQIRAAMPDDHDAWLPLWEAYNVFYGNVGEKALPAEVTATTWGRFFDAYEPVHALVAERDGALLGFTHYLFHRSTSLIAPTCYLEDLFTVEAARGQGVGGALIEGVYAAARAAGVSRVYWLTQEGNATARRLYDRIAEKSDFIVYDKAL
jgi:GNAT superfamily N-acetyltransferase